MLLINFDIYHNFLIVNFYLVIGEKWQMHIKHCTFMHVFIIMIKKANQLNFFQVEMKH